MSDFIFWILVNIYKMAVLGKRRVIELGLYQQNTLKGSDNGTSVVV